MTVKCFSTDQGALLILLTVLRATPSAHVEAASVLRVAVLELEDVA